MKIALSAETAIDLTSELLKKFKINTIPFSIILGEKVIKDEIGVTPKIFDFVSKTKELPKTSAVNQMQYREYFKKLLETNDIILHISISSTLSSAYQNASTIAKELGEDKIKVIDSYSASCGIALLSIYARKLIDNNLQINDIVNTLNKKKEKIAISFVANNLEYLKRGGRCSKLQYLGANLLKIKPEIVYEKGEAKPAKKFLGLFHSVINPYFKDVVQRYSNPNLENVFLVYTTAEQKDLDNLKNKLINKGFKNIYITQTGGTISSHIGPNAIGIMFINDNSQN